MYIYINTHTHTHKHTNKRTHKQVAWPPLPYNYTGDAINEVTQNSAHAKSMELLHGSRFPNFKDITRTYTEGLSCVDM